MEISGNFLFYDVIAMGLLLLFDNVSTAVVVLAARSLYRADRLVILEKYWSVWEPIPCAII